MSHTPAPWEITCHTAEDVDSITPGCDWSIDGADGKSVCFEGGYNDCASANARLIAAAPELLEALQDLLSAYDFQMGQYEEGDVQQEARAAIAKATGK